MELKEKIKLFPHSPGVYRYYDAEGNVIYVGKAKDLHKRVAQYFVPADRLTRKTAVMVSKIADAEYTVVDSESDALLLENNLIKQFKPRYNILLKDSKTYPWICVSAEEFPRVFLTRRMVKDGSRYFGPYSSVVHARNLVEFFHNVYPLRTCSHKITSDAILRGKFRPCLNFHIKKCSGCCVGGISRKEYGDNIEEIVKLLKGGGREIIQHYRNLMQEAAMNMEFEQAQIYKEKMLSLEQHYSKSVIMNSIVGDVDVFSLIVDGSEAFGNFMRIRGGAVVQSLNLGFQTVVGGRILHHGTILFNADVEVLSNALTPDPEKIKSKGVKSVVSRVANLSEFMGESATAENLISAISAEVWEMYGAREYLLSEDEIKRAETLADKKYRTWDWNFGYSPKYSFSKRKRFDGGSISAYLSVVDGKIESAKLFGDFFFISELSDIENALCGVKHEKSEIESVLNNFKISDYFSKIPLEGVLETLL